MSENLVDQINDRTNQMNKLLRTLRDTCGEIISRLGPEVALMNTILAEVEAAENVKKKLFEENRILENDIEYKKQTAKKIEEEAHKKAAEILAVANQRNAQSIRILDQSRGFHLEADLREKKNKLVATLGE